jgi:REP element-mobilizing transposase RayT
MPNHVHFVFRFFEENKTHLSKLMQSIKGGSAYRINRFLNKHGQLWQHESYDHLVRDNAELNRITGYVLQNPVKAGLCNEAKKWAFNYVKECYDDYL